MGIVYCFEQSGELRLRDFLKLNQPITSLTWTTQYDKLAVSTDQVSSAPCSLIALLSIT